MNRLSLNQMKAPLYKRMNARQLQWRNKGLLTGSCQPGEADLSCPLQRGRLLHGAGAYLQNA